MKIRLTALEGTSHRSLVRSKRMIIEIHEDGRVTIMREGAPLIDRDTSTVITVGSEPTWFDLVMRVEVAE